jgi:putative Holliday junction resolvase
MKHLAIDFGEKRIGLAISDDAGRLALPYGTHERGGHKHDIAYLESAVRGLGIEAIVFGLPRALQDEAQSEARETKVRAFAALLEEALRAAKREIPIVWWDERFSTREAQHQLRSLGVSQKSSRESGGSESIDARAAAVILQGFLDSRSAPPEA